MTNFADELTRAAADAGDRPAVKLDDLVLSFALLDGAAARAAGMLKEKGVGPGDRVGMQLPNVPYFPIVYFGALRLGAVVVPMNPLLKEREVGYHLSDSGSKILVAWHGFEDAARGWGATRRASSACSRSPASSSSCWERPTPVEEVAERDDGDAAVIIYTSGTTGTPKGATLTHANLASGAETARDLVGAGTDFSRPRDPAAVPRVRHELGDEHGRAARGR